MILSAERKQEIVRDYCLRNGGVYHPAGFFDEVTAAGPTHEAWEYFQWEKERGWREHNIHLARMFVNGLRVRFIIEEVGRSGKIVTRETITPLVQSSINERRNNGGYVLLDPNDPAHIAEMARQAALALNAFCSRYELAVRKAGGSLAPIERLEGLLRVLAGLDGDLAEAAE